MLAPAAVATPYLCLLFLLVSLGWYASLRHGVYGVLLTLLAGLTYDVIRREFLLADLVVNVVIIAMAWAAGHLTGGISTTVYRVVQEALTNVVRHSDARSARVVVRRDGPILFAQVCDDGQTVEARTPGAGRGLSGLAERVRVFDGTVTSGRTPSGWEVEARIPLDSTTP